MPPFYRFTEHKYYIKVGAKFKIIFKGKSNEEQKRYINRHQYRMTTLKMSVVYILREASENGNKIIRLKENQNVFYQNKTNYSR